MLGFSQQESHYQRARASLRDALSRYSPWLRSTTHDATIHPDLLATLKQQLDILSDNLNKLDQRVIRIAAFGLVSRGKSAVLNALLNRKVLQTGPLNGVTQFPYSVRWSAIASDKAQVELIDTPGLDEVDGQARADLAKEIAHQADLILFVVAGDITRTEYQALCELRQAQKPVILVFNKIDLYPEHDRQAIYQQLQNLAVSGDTEAQPLISPQEIVMVSAEPTPLQVRVEMPDGTVRHEWETPPPQVVALKQKLLEILNREGRALLALNALRQAREADETIAQTTLQLCETEADKLIWRFMRYKALAIALNPFAVLDLLASTLTDLLMIRALAKLYGLPITNHEAGKLLQTILLSAGGVLLGELGSGLLLGFGKSAAALTSAVDTVGGVTAYAGAAIAQAGLASYGAYAVGQATKRYLAQGCTWGPQGANTVIKTILSQVEPNTILNRLRRDILSSTAIPKRWQSESEHNENLSA